MTSRSAQAPVDAARAARLDHASAPAAVVRAAAHLACGLLDPDDRSSVVNQDSLAVRTPAGAGDRQTDRVTRPVELLRRDALLPGPGEAGLFQHATGSGLGFRRAKAFVAQEVGDGDVGGGWRSHRPSILSAVPTSEPPTRDPR